MSGSKIPPDSDLTNAKWYSDWSMSERDFALGVALDTMAIDGRDAYLRCRRDWRGSLWRVDGVDLTRRKQRVLLVDAYGPGHTRASSGGESRIIRMAYGPDGSTRGGRLLRLHNGRLYLSQPGNRYSCPQASCGAEAKANLTCAIR